MTLVQNIAKNTFFLTISEIIQKGLLFFLMIYAVRVLGKVDFGKYSFAVAFTYFFLIIAEIGLTTIITRDVARDLSKAQKYFSNLFLLKISLFIISSILIYLLINLLEYPTLTVIVVMIFAIVTLGDDLNAFLLSFFKAHQNMGYVALSKIIQNCMIFVLGGLALYLGYGIIGFSIAFAFSTILTTLISLIVIKKYVVYKLLFSLRFIVDKIKVSLWFVVITVLQCIIFRIDTIMLSLMRGDADVGIYNSSYMILGALLFIPGVYCTTIYPILSKFFINSKDSFFRIVRLSSKYVILGSFLIAAVIFLLAEFIITLIYPAEFLGAIHVLQILAPALFFLFINYFLYNVAYSANLHKQMIVPFAFGAILNIILNLILIPLYGPVGAAISTAITELLMLVMTWYILKKAGIKVPLTLTKILSKEDIRLIKELLGK